MTTYPEWTIFSRTNPGHQTPQQWRGANPAVSWRTTARAYARAQGDARTLLADGRVLRYLWDGTRMRQRTYTQVKVVM